MNAKHSVLAVACVVLIAGISGATASDLPGSSPANPLSAEQAFEVDVQGVAKALQISPDAARSRLNVERNLRPILKRVRSQYANRLAGVYIEHEPTSRLVVRLTGYDAVRPEFHQFGADRLEVNYELGADHTLADLQRTFDAKFPALIERVPGVQGGYVDQRTGEVVVDVLKDARLGKLADVQRLAVGHFDFKAPVQIETMDAPLVNQVVKGSGSLTFTQASTSGVQCTGAFTVRTTASPISYGTLTAGHCQPDSSTSFNYAEALTSTTIHTLTLQGVNFTSSADVGWARVSNSASDVSNEFYVGTWRELEGAILKEDLAPNMSLCRYGRNGGAGCGLVQATNYNPGSTCGPGLAIGTGTSSCSSTYVDVQTASGLCVSGDSGGPWINSENLAAGVHKAGSGTRCVFTAIDEIAALGVQLVL